MMKVKIVEEGRKVWLTSTYMVQYVAILLWATWSTLDESTQQQIIALMFGKYAPVVAIGIQVAATMAARGTSIEWNPPWRKKVDIEVEDVEDRP